MFRLWNHETLKGLLNDGLVPLVSSADPSSLSNSLGVATSKETSPQFEPDSATDMSSPPKFSVSIVTFGRPRARFRPAR